MKDFEEYDERKDLYYEEERRIMGQYLILKDVEKGSVIFCNE